MQYIFGQHESINVPIELVSYVKSLIQTHNMNLLNSRMNQYNQLVMPTLPTLPPLPPPPQIVSPPEYTQRERNLNIIKPTNRDNDTNHTICNDWMKGNCKNINCKFDHNVYPGFKTIICYHWENGYCRYDSIKCRHAHGKSDPYNRLKKEPLYFIDNFSKNPKRSRSRSRSRSPPPKY